MGQGFSGGGSWGLLGISSLMVPTQCWRNPCCPKTQLHMCPIPGEADQHVARSQLGVVPPHPAVLVEQQGEGAVPISGEDDLVGARLEKPKAPP